MAWYISVWIHFLFVCFLWSVVCVVILFTLLIVLSLFREGKYVYTHIILFIAPLLLLFPQLLHATNLVKKSQCPQSQQQCTTYSTNIIVRYYVVLLALSMLDFCVYIWLPTCKNDMNRKLSILLSILQTCNLRSSKTVKYTHSTTTNQSSNRSSSRCWFGESFFFLGRFLSPSYSKVVRVRAAAGKIVVVSLLYVFIKTRALSFV